MYFSNIFIYSFLKLFTVGLILFVFFLCYREYERNENITLFKAFSYWIVMLAIFFINLNIQKGW